jgi:hypothetical protein
MWWHWKKKTYSYFYFSRKGLCLWYTAVLFKPVFLAYHSHNTKHVRVPLGAVNIKAYFQDTSLPGYFAV